MYNMTMKDQAYPILQFETQKEFEEWLSKNHDKEQGVWLQFAKKGTGVTTIVYSEALDVALCYGWIDGQSKRFDDTFYLQKFVPRGRKSIWSKINRENVLRLIKEGRMRPSGLLQIDAAKKDGRWDQAYDSPKNMKVPEDFLNELKKDKNAYAFYQTLNRANTYAIAWRLQTAKKPETREKRIHAIIDMLKKGEKFH